MPWAAKHLGVLVNRASASDYATLFARLGWGSITVGFALVALIRFLRKLIGDKDTPADSAPARQTS